MRQRTLQLSLQGDGPKLAPDQIVSCASEIVRSYVEYNRAPASEVAAMVSIVHAELSPLNNNGARPQLDSKGPAVSVKKSVGDNFIICLEDGKRLTMLKRYLKTHYNMSPEGYRKKWDLPSDYPMVAPAYARWRSAFAKKIGLGRVPTTKAKR